MGIVENIIIILYLAFVGYLGFLGYKQTKNTTDYLVAGRDTHPFIMALSYGATFISTAAIVGFGGVAAWLGNSLLWLTFFNIFVGIFIAFVFLGNPTRKMGYRLNAHTFPELLAKRFDSKFIQLFAAIIILLFMPLYATAVLIGGTHFLTLYFNVDYHLALLVFSIIITAYVIAGGLKGVMLTDALQGTIMFVAMVILLYFTFDSLGGIKSAFEKLDIVWETTVSPILSQELSSFKPGSADFMMKLSTLWGFSGWNKMPTFLSPGWLFVITTITLGVGIGVLAQPQLVVRFMTVKSKQELNRAVLIGGVFIVAMTGIVFIVGSLTNAWYYEFNEGKNALQSAGTIGKVIPHFINTAMPKWFSFIFLFALISAAMSTLSSQFHTMGTAVGRDLIEQIKGGGNSVMITRVGIILMIVLSVALAYVFDNQPAIIARSTAIFFALCAAIFLPSFIGGLFWKRMTKAGAISSMLVGFFVSSFWLLFVHFKEAKELGISKAIFGVDSLLGGKIIFVDALVISLPLSILTAIIVSLLTKPMSQEHLKKCFD
ncbi:sodium:solute symporter family protein [Halarcobacter ebronensis]|uniref:Sodium:solute symporter n=1 Tax=Halarcobacter ebronensis TaxID=1462615 RepID=A0A4V1M0A9_9BACT|nr:sodium:solute symporter family protein [Halarcobacter ebronensis]QKF81956.1 sodium:solute symporter [Halarcobacter ebronensis]RXK04327.1 sodium:solute symporter [Halarcobacter ebronensis]